MAQGTLQGKKIAALITNGVEEVEFTEPAKALRDAGAHVQIISLSKDPVRAWNKGQWGDTFQVDKTVDQASVDDFDGLLIPGGVMSPDKLRMNDHAVRLVRQMVSDGKPIASICHGPWMLVEADAVRGRTLTSYPSLRTDIINAGGSWIDTEVTVDSGIITSRSPSDLDAFCAKMIEEFAEGTHERPEEAGGTDIVTEASEESFPASDAPGWGGSSTTA